MIKVLVVDDSIFDRKLISHILDRNGDIEVVGMAENPYEARQLIADLQPDVITLDMLMPKMNGLTFLSKIMEHFPLPVVVVSSVTPQNSKTALSALSMGAVEVISKPTMEYSAYEMSDDLVQAVRVASKANVRPGRPQVRGIGDSEIDYVTDQIYPFEKASKQVIAIGASTGGTRALEIILPELPENIPGTVVVQHMPAVFTKNFAIRLNNICRAEVSEAKHGDKIEPGKVLVAPGNFHMGIQKIENAYYVSVFEGERVNYHRPSVDVLFNSVASEAGEKALGVILTGMGSDGAKGLLNMYRNGAYTIAQDEKSSVVYGMPKEAYKAGGVSEVLPLTAIPDAIISQLTSKQMA